MRKFWKTSFFVLLLISLVSACTGLAGEPDIVSTMAPRPTSVPETFDRVVNLDQGASIFAENCVRCHGITGAGDGELVLAGQIQDVPSFTDPATIADMSLDEWFGVITNGRLEKLMPPWKDSLSAEERWSVALYTYTMSYTSSSFEQGQAIYEAQCADCHAVDGSGTDDGTSVQGLVNFTESSLQETLAAHQADLELDPAVVDDSLSAVVQYTRLLSAESQALPDPNTVVEQTEPTSTEESTTDNATTQDVPTDTSDVPQSIGILRGQIIQGTEGGAPVDGLEALIHIYDSQLNEQIGEYVVGADGVYQYDEVVIRPDYAYRVTVNYNDVMFSSQIVIGDPETTEMELDVTIYETGATEDDIVISSRAVQVNLTTQGLYIIEVVDILNTSDQVYVRDSFGGVEGQVSLGFALPEGAQLQLDHTDPNRIGLSEDGLTVLDLVPVLPNMEHYAQYSYLLPLENAREIVQPVDYTIDGPIAFYIENSHMGFSSPQTEFMETREFNGQQYDVHIVSETPAIGDEITYGIELLDNPVTNTSDNQTIPREVLAIVLVIGGLVLLGGAGVVIWRSRQPQPDEPAKSPTTQASLMKEIALLDNAYEAGDITQDDYQKQRDQLKKQLMVLMREEEKK
jgi:mono/diheme cytochrome c family protein